MLPFRRWPPPSLFEFEYFILVIIAKNTKKCLYFYVLVSIMRFAFSEKFY